MLFADKNIPQKSRLARKTGNTDSNNLKKNSITYLKSEDNPGVFFKTDSFKVVHEISFVDAAKIFKADPKEEAEKKLPENHHEQIKDQV